MMERLYCNACIDMKEIIIKKEKHVFEVKGEKIEAEIKVTYCKECGEEVYNRKLEIENDKIVFNYYKRKIGLLTSIEVKSIRDKYGLSQKTFAKLLGFGEKTITRYESGSIQDETHDRLMRLIDDEENFLRIWKLLPKKFTLHENKKVNQYLDSAFNTYTQNEYKVVRDRGYSFKTCLPLGEKHHDHS